DPNTGEEVTLKVIDPKTGKPYARLAGPNAGGVIGAGSLNGRGYLVVEIPTLAGSTLNVASVTDISPEFKIENDVLTLDNSQAPVLVDGKFWYWVNGNPATTSVNIIWLK